jgi:hypothetical protein
MATLDRIEKSAHLVAIPHSAALDLWQGHVSAVDVVEDGGDLHCRIPERLVYGKIVFDCDLEFYLVCFKHSPVVDLFIPKIEFYGNFQRGAANEANRFVRQGNVTISDDLERLIAGLKCPGGFGILDAFCLQKIK